MCLSPLEVDGRGLEIGKQTLGNAKGQGRTKETGVGGIRGSAMGRGKTRRVTVRIIFGGRS